MKFCQDHWDRLRAAIDARGLGGLVARDGERALENMAAELEAGPGAASLTTFDPLMGAHWAIVNNIMGFVGLAVMAPNADGSERCPLCFLNAAHDEQCVDPGCVLPRDGTAYDGWIDRAADDMRAERDRLLAEGTS
jgi:hypothetical protein